MTTLSDNSTTSSGQKHKKTITYGRTSRNATFSAPTPMGTFFDDSVTPTHAPATAKTTTGQLSPARKRLPRVMSNRTPAKLAPLRDEFDVPLDEEGDQAETISRHPTTARLKTAAKDNRPANEATKKRKLSSAHSTLPKKMAILPDSPRDPQKIYDAPHDTDLPQRDNGLPRRMKRSAMHLTTNPPAFANGRSAPANLKSMVLDLGDSDSEELSSRVALPTRGDMRLLSRGAKLPQTTPGRSTSSRPRTLQRSLSTTPKQSSLWDQLLPSDPVEPPLEAPDARRRQLITNHESSSKPENARERALAPKARTPTGMLSHRPRLVDRLKETRPVEEDDVSDAEDEETGDSASEIEGPAVTTEDKNKSTVLGTDSVCPESQPDVYGSQQVSDQSASGPRVTYAATRSYLEEDNLMDDLMLSLQAPTPAPLPKPSAASRSQSTRGNNSQAHSAFGLDSDSDDAGDQAIRSIHELRAAGSKKRFTDDNEALVSDIKDHGPTSRSRRRGAFLELSEKLDDKTFMKRFIEYGFDRELVSEFTYVESDAATDMVILAVLAKVLNADVVQRSALLTHKVEILGFVYRYLAATTAFTRIAKDRRSNMSKAGQKAFLDFAESVRSGDMWGAETPTQLSGRLLALKCTEMMVLQRRKQGDRTVMLAPAAVTALVNMLVDREVYKEQLFSEPHYALGLSISVLEAASPLDVNGPSEAIWTSSLAQLVPLVPTMLERRDKTQFLALRLLLNLTVNNTRNREHCCDKELLQAVVTVVLEGCLRLQKEHDLEQIEALRGTVLIALGFTIVLAENSDAVCELVSALPDDTLASLIKIFLQGREQAESAESLEGAENNVIYGYLAALLANVCRVGISRSRVAAHLPGGQLKVVVEAVEEFIEINRQADSKLAGDEGSEAYLHHTRRLNTAIEALRESVV